MQLTVERDIKKISALNWDSVAKKENLFQYHAFLDGLNKAKVEDAELYFLLFSEGDKPIATVVLSNFYIHLDLFIGNGLIIKRLKTTVPSLFKTKVLFCGTPISAGHHNFYVSDKAYWDEVLNKTEEFMENLALEKKCSILIFKELNEQQVTNFSVLASKNYSLAHSLPNVILDLPFDNYKNYLNALKHGYRRQLISSMKKIACLEPIFVNNEFKNIQEENHPVFTFLDVNDKNATLFYNLYKSVMHRAKVKLEELNESFFREFFHCYQERIKLLTMVFKGEILGIFVLLKLNNQLYFLWAGKNQEKDQWDSYANLMNALVYFAINQKCTKVILGQTSYYPKLKTGGEIQNLFFYIKARKSWKNWLIKKFNPWLFPSYTIQKLSVFKHKN